MKKYSRNHWMFALRNEDLRPLVNLTGGLALVLLVLAAFNPHSDWASFFAMAALVMAGLFAWAVWAGLSTFERVRGNTAEALASRWVRDGDDEFEVRRRRDMVLGMGAMSALATTGISFEPRVNFSGLAMVDGANIDVEGHGYGFTGEEPYAVDAANGVMLTPDHEYARPYGMDTSADIGTTSGSSGSSVGM